jgi:hypothetical protein
VRGHLTRGQDWHRSSGHGAYALPCVGHLGLPLVELCSLHATVARLASLPHRRVHCIPLSFASLHRAWPQPCHRPCHPCCARSHGHDRSLLASRHACTTPSPRLNGAARAHSLVALARCDCAGVTSSFTLPPPRPSTMSLRCFVFFGKGESISGTVSHARPSATCSNS